MCFDEKLCGACGSNAAPGAMGSRPTRLISSQDILRIYCHELLAPGQSDFDPDAVPAHPNCSARDRLHPPTGKEGPPRGTEPDDAVAGLHGVHKSRTVHLSSMRWRMAGCGRSRSTKSVVLTVFLRLRSPLKLQRHGDRCHKILNPACCWRFLIETCLRRNDQLKWAHEQAQGDNI